MELSSANVACWGIGAPGPGADHLVV